MQHFVVPRDAIRDNAVVFVPAQAHQITRVLRLRDGDEVIVLDGLGAQYRVRLATGSKEAHGEIVGPAEACHEPERRVTLLVAPPKGERWEWLLQKGTEIGVARFIPLVTRYTQPGAATLKARHHQIVREAAEQCRRLLVPAIEEPRSLVQALAGAAHTNTAKSDARSCAVSATGPAREGTAATVLLWEGAHEQGLSASLRPAIARGVTNLRLIVGPEGGFHPDEVALARECGAAVAGLGPLILRAETAAVVAAALALSASDSTS